jgi:hypothetical protein
VRRFRVRGVREDRGRFAALHGERVFIYWPHGLGDWAHVAAILPLLEPSNAYAIARFGDDYASLLDGDAYVRVLRSGSRALGDGCALGARHLGLARRRLNGAMQELVVADPLAEQLAAFDPTVVLWTDYPETEGRTAFPFHTKARNAARLLVARERLAAFDLTKPLPTTVDAGVDGALQRAVDERLNAFAPPGTRRYVLSIAGFSAERKNWDAAQARRFVHLLQRDDARARALVMGDAALGDKRHWPGREIVAGFHELFGDLDAPFARAYLALLARADGVVGVPAGPLHVAMICRGIPIVGLWAAHLPEWYDEPNPDAMHLVGSYVGDRHFDRRPATATLPPAWHRKTMLDARVIPAEAVLAALRLL